MTNKYPSEQKDRYIVRLPDGMRGRIAETAKLSGRSMNAEIVLRLEKSFVEGGEIPQYVQSELIDRAAAKGTSLATEVELLLEYSKDKFVRWTHAALSDATRRDIVRKAHRLGHSVQHEIQRRLEELKSTRSLSIQLTIKSEVDLQTTAVFDFLSALGKQADIANIERFEIQVVPANEPTAPTPDLDFLEDRPEEDAGAALRTLRRRLEDAGIDIDTLEQNK